MTDGLVIDVQPGEVTLWYPTTIVRCKCKDQPGQTVKLNIVILTGFDNWASCGACGTVYANSHLVQNPTTGAAMMVVKNMAPTPQGEVN